MAVNRMEAGKGEGAPAEKRTEASPAAESAPRPAAASPLQAWLPLAGAVLLMPILAYGVTTFVLLPKLQKGLGIAPAAQEAAASGGHGTAAPKAGGHGSEAKSGGHGAPAKTASASSNGREQVPLTKLLVNVSGTSASRILMASLMLVGTSTELATSIQEREPQLRDTACGILAIKTIPDLEKPGARNVLRGELITAFNEILGGSLVQEIYFTDFAIQ